MQGRAASSGQAEAEPPVVDAQGRGHAGDPPPAPRAASVGDTSVDALPTSTTATMHLPPQPLQPPQQPPAPTLPALSSTRAGAVQAGAAPVLPAPGTQAVPAGVGQQPPQPPHAPPLPPPLDMQELLDIVELWPEDELRKETVNVLVRECMEHLRGVVRPGASVWIDHRELQHLSYLVSGLFSVTHQYAWGERRRVVVRWTRMDEEVGSNRREYVSAAKRFVREVLHLVELRHPHIEDLLGLTEDQDREPGFGIVLEDVTHGTLSQTLHTGGHLITPQLRLAWAMQVADAMKYLHSRQPPVVHRALQGDNIFIDGHDHAKLGGFHASVRQPYLRVTHDYAVTAWAPPEAVMGSYQVQGVRVLPTWIKESDVYSFGLLLGLLATGQGPWAGLDDLDRVQYIATGYRLHPPQGLVQPDLYNLIARCMSEQPAHRPSFGAVLEALRLLEPDGIIPCGTWPEPSDDVPYIPAASGQAAAASVMQAGDVAGSSGAPSAPPHLPRSASPQPPVQPPTPSAPSTPQHTQPHAPTAGHAPGRAPAGHAGHAPGTTIADFAQSLLDSVGRWPDEQLRANRETHTDLLKTCVLQMREKLGGLWIDPQQLELGHVIGEGGYAVVLQAKQAPEGQQVALKQFHVFTPDGRTKVQSFVKEVCLLSQLQHTNIVTLHHFTANLQCGWLGIVLEWAGDSLAAKLAEEKEGRLVITPQQRLEWAIGMADGLAYLHGPGLCIVHRDLTVRNIMIDQHGQAKLIDLGISQVLTHTHLTVNRAGCPAWMAPELLGGQQRAKGLQVLSLADEKSDIYSLGLCLGALATHCQPWEGHDAEIAFTRDNFRLGVPQVQQPWLQELIQQCMEEPARRPAIDEVLRVLRQHSEEGILHSAGAWPIHQPSSDSE